MKSRTLVAIDSGLAWAEDTKFRTECWFKAHVSWAYRAAISEEQLTLTLSFTGRLRERARRYAMARIKRRMMADGASGPFLDTDGRAWQIELNKADCPGWLADLPQTGVVRIPTFDDAEIAASHHDPLRGPAHRR
jgi:hypothetical protein